MIEDAVIYQAGQPVQVVAHTPGPWKIVDDELLGPDDQGIASLHIYTHEDFPCAEDEQEEEVNAESAANARLIIAAPELLAACHDADCACTVRDRNSGHLVGCWMPAMQEAIAKATGKGAE